MVSLKKYWSVPSMQTFLWLAPTLRRNKFSPPFFKILGEQIWKGETRGCWKTTGSDIVYLKSWKVLPCLKMFSTWPMTNNDLLWYSRNKNVNSKLRCYKRLLQFWKASTTDDRTDWVITKFIFWHDYQIALAVLSKYVWHICQFIK